MIPQPVPVLSPNKPVASVGGQFEGQISEAAKNTPSTMYWGIVFSAMLPNLILTLSEYPHGLL